MLQAAPVARDRQSRALIPLHHLRSSLPLRPTTFTSAQTALKQALVAPLQAIPPLPRLALLFGLGEALFFSEPDSQSPLPRGLARPAVDIAAGSRTPPDLPPVHGP